LLPTIYEIFSLMKTTTTCNRTFDRIHIRHVWKTGRLQETTACRWSVNLRLSEWKTGG